MAGELQRELARVGGQLDRVVPMVERIDEQLREILERLVRLEERDRRAGEDHDSIDRRLDHGDGAFEQLRLRVQDLERDAKEVRAAGREGRSRWWDVALLAVGAGVSAVVAWVTKGGGS